MLIFLTLCLSALAGTLQVHVLDVGQGDSILIEAPGDKKVLIDAGTSKSNVLEKLKKRGIKKLNLVVSTHPHADHIGGMPAILKGMDVGMYVDNGMTHSTLTYARTTQAVESRGVPYRAGVNGRSFNVGSEVKLTILHPRSNPLRGTRSDLNSNSVVIRLDHKDICFLFTGDAEDPTERDLMNRGLGKCEVLKVAHHGSAHSTSASLLRAVQPRYAVISAGAGNRYGHPAPETLARLKSAEVEVHRTDLEGTVTFISSGRSISIQTQRSASAPSNPDENVSAVASHEQKIHMQPGSTINVNTAGVAQLEEFHGVGPVKASAIIADRTANGPFTSCEEVQRVHGVGPKTIQGMRNRCVVEDAEPATNNNEASDKE